MSLLSLSQPLLVKIAGKILNKAAEDESSEIGTAIKEKIEEWIEGTDSGYDDVALDAIEEILGSEEYAEKAKELIEMGRTYIESTDTSVDDMLLLPVLTIIEDMLPETSDDDTEADETEETATEDAEEESSSEESAEEAGDAETAEA